MLSLLMLAACAPEDDGLTCAGQDDCHAVEGGRYLARTPEGWDGASPLPLALHYHGYGGTAAGSMASSPLQQMLDRGYLVVAPDGLINTWAHVGSPSVARDELAFFDAVLADVLDRWPTDPARRLTTGFSQGGSMVWDLACQRHDALAAFLPVSGAFWEPLPAACGGPLRVRHTHGLDDRTVPMAGRPIGDAMQGDVLEGWALLLQAAGCGEAPDEVFDEGVTTCSRWSTCAEGAELVLCLHEGGHGRPEGWLDQAFTWAESPL